MRKYKIKCRKISTNVFLFGKYEIVFTKNKWAVMLDKQQIGLHSTFVAAYMFCNRLLNGVEDGAT